MRGVDRRSGREATAGWRRGGLLTALTAVLTALLVGVVGAGAASAATLAADNFEDGNAAGWTTTGGTWIVVNEDSRVLRQSSYAANALARTGAPGWRDYIVSADVRPISFNGLPGHVGVVARAQSTNTYYALVLRPDNTAALLRVVSGRAATLATMPVAVRAGATYDLTFRLVGNALTGWVEGVGFSATDNFILQGPAGLTTTWASASFDNAWVRT